MGVATRAAMVGDPVFLASIWIHCARLPVNVCACGCACVCDGAVAC
jgi:hypothetical protein